MKALSVAGIGLLLSFAAQATEPELSMNGYNIGDSMQSVKDKTDKECQVSGKYKEDSDAEELAKSLYGDSDIIWSCIGPSNPEIPTHRMLFEFQKNKLVTIFSDVEDGHSDEATKWIMSKFGAPEEISNSFAKHNVRYQREGAENYGYFASRKGLIRERINGRKEQRVFLYVMDGKSQNISPINSPYFR